MAEEVQDVGEAVVDEAVVGENNVVVDEAADVTVAEGAAESMTEGAAEGAAGGAAQGVTRKDKPKKRMRGPHMGVMGGKQIWNDCVGEFSSHDRWAGSRGLVRHAPLVK